MSRTSIIIILGIGTSLMVAIMAVTAFMFGRSYFMISDSDTQVLTPPPIVVETAVVDNQATATPTTEPAASATAESGSEPTATTPATAAPTNITVLNTQVQYVMALTDLNMRSGPGTGYNVISWLADGQTAKVTGVSSDYGWWRVICPDDTVGSCWVSAGSRFTQTANAPATAVACVDAATFVADVTVPDGTVLAPTTGFNKIWRLKNSGTCTWNTSYKLVHAGGHLLNAVSTAFPIGNTVAPGQTIDLTINNMVSPASAGTYQSDWKLQNGQAQVFGIGANRSTPFWVKIVVADQSRPSGSISGYAWQDKDRDNVVDGNELLPNVTITLATGQECRMVLSSSKTDGNGRFTFTNLAANTYCLIGSDGSTTVSQANLALGNNQHLTEVKVTWPPLWPQLTTISGLIYQDLNQNGAYDQGEPLQANREVWLIPETACHVQQSASAVTFSGNNGRYTLAGEFSGNYCVGLAGGNGLEDVIGITVSPGQTRDNLNLKAAIANGSISGWLWNDYCLTNNVGQALAGDCVVDFNGNVHADGQIQPTESYISGVTILLQAGPCSANNVKVSTVTDGNGKYVFSNLQPGTYCVSMNAAEGGNGDKLLPGDWTFPARGIWYQEVTLRAGGQASPVNFGWDYQLK